MLKNMKSKNDNDQQKENIEYLLRSTDFNQSKEEEMKIRLAELSEEAKK